jgi:hypothetical protein
MSTRPDVFIIESLDPDDEGNGRCEGSSISHVLRLHGKEPKYRYVRTREQFEDAIADFARSNYRYLHISVDADSKGMCTTNQDGIDYDELADLMTPALNKKRLFLSACSMVHEEMAREIVPKTGCYSVVGPREDIAFTAAAVFWPAIYHLMFTINDRAMTHSVLKRNLEKVTSLFGIEIGYFSRSKKAKRGYTTDILKR